MRIMTFAFEFEGEPNNAYVATELTRIIDELEKKYGKRLRLIDSAEGHAIGMKCNLCGKGIPGVIRCGDCRHKP